MLTRIIRTFILVVGFLTAGVATSQAKEADVMLLEAVLAGDLARLRSAIGAGADLEFRDGDGRTALLVATRKNDVDVARLLIEAGADVNAKDSIEDTPFLYAGAEGRDEILKLILATGKANLKDTNRYGGTALIPAADHGYPETVRILLGTAIDIDHVNNLGWTALLEAVILGDGGPVQQEIVGLLIDAGAKNLPDGDGVTALDHARQRGFKAMVRRIEAGPRK